MAKDTPPPSPDHTTIAVTQEHASPLGTLQKLPTELRLCIYEETFAAFEGKRGFETNMTDRKSFFHPLLNTTKHIRAEALNSYKQRLDGLVQETRLERTKALLARTAWLESHPGRFVGDTALFEAVLKEQRSECTREVEVARMRAIGY